MKELRRGNMPLLSWDIYMNFYTDTLEEINREFEIEELNVYKKKFDWNFDIVNLLKKSTYQALVLTNSQQIIQWVNDGFKTMTGYSVSFAKNKKPSFLQGENTCPDTIETIRKHIHKAKPVKETVINYRKSGEEYKCELSLYPIKNNKEEVTHYLALEREVVTR